MNELPVNELATILTGVVSMVILWLARYFIAWVNTQRGITKMLISLALGFAITKLKQLSGAEIGSLTDLLDPNIAQSLATWVVSMGLWALVKEVQKYLGKYNLTRLSEEAKSMKNFMVAVLVVSGLLIFSGQSESADLKLSDNWTLHETSGFVMKSGDANNQLSTGVFYGPVAELKTASGKAIVGFGGMAGSIKVDDRGDISGVIGITPVTFFDNMIQLSVVGQISEFRLSDPDSYMLMVGFRPIATGQWLYKKTSAVAELMVP